MTHHLVVTRPFGDHKLGSFIVGETAMAVVLEAPQTRQNVVRVIAAHTHVAAEELVVVAPAPAVIPANPAPQPSVTPKA